MHRDTEGEYMNNKPNISNNGLEEFLREVYGREITDQEYLESKHRLTEYFRILIEVDQRERVIEKIEDGELKSKD
jgi:t-SNARE complex subunit (syntaxin)